MTPSTVEELVHAAAASSWPSLPAAARADALEAVADALDAASTELAELADAETSLGSERLAGEVGRTTGQLRMFAERARAGGYVGAILSPADPASGRPDVRRMLRPIGPVAVFAASNFPFAFSVAGGDAASALAVGAPVVIKAHEGHPRTSARTAELVATALRGAGAPDGAFAIAYGRQAGLELVTHPGIRAVGFTGSRAGGRALFDLATGRPDPIPFYGELGSINPVVLLPGAVRERAADLARGYVASLTLGVGQFCTNPGLLFVPDEKELLQAVAGGLAASHGGSMLNTRISDGYRAATAASEWTAQRLLGRGSGGATGTAEPQVRTVDLAGFAQDVDRLSEERFGPAGLVVTYGGVPDLVEVLRELPGSLTASVHAAEEDLDYARDVADVLLPLAGRLVMNGWPTGVAVCWAMHHGGPWPATTAAAYTSVGATAAERWLVPVAYQDWPDELLPPQLQDANPLRIDRLTQS